MPQSDAVNDVVVFKNHREIGRHPDCIQHVNADSETLEVYDLKTRRIVHTYAKGEWSAGGIGVLCAHDADGQDIDCKVCKTGTHKVNVRSE